jgi:hypothetical protein
MVIDVLPENLALARLAGTLAELAAEGDRVKDGRNVAAAHNFV